MSMGTPPRDSVTSLCPGTVKDAIREAYAPAAEAQRLAAKSTLAQEEVSALYGLSVSMLEKMRADNRGPACIINLGRNILCGPRRSRPGWKSRPSSQEQSSRHRAGNPPGHRSGFFLFKSQFGQQKVS